MKLFLSSMAISKEQSDAFARLVGKKPKDIRLALIENAADVYGADSIDWVIENREAIKARGYKVELVDLREYKGRQLDLRTKLASKDVVWLGGGNTFYLRWILKDVGADNIIKELVQNGMIYGGGSAGAIVAGPTLKFFENADDPKESPEVIVEGLNLTKKVVVPHIRNKDYGGIVCSISKSLQRDGYETIEITDEQVAVIDGNNIQILSH